ncbi:hypothetical protein LCL97_00620 [Seohaeicola saemankumensis]|nr:hypothetical protein [Seohaeicola saemankumensis]MCA0869313.1 hypothetical protein [Seohaeicola saemankumensis]
MSDPVTNVQIEDVLSSIRRLVSEESRLETRAKPEGTPRSSDRLVLTPALRVADDPVEDAQVEEPVTDDPAPEAEGAEPETAPVETVTEPLTLSDPIEVVDEDAGNQNNEAPWQDPTATLFEAAQSPVVEDDDIEDPKESLDAAEAPPVEAGDEEDVVEIEEADVVYDDAEEIEATHSDDALPESEDAGPEIETADLAQTEAVAEDSDDQVWQDLQSLSEPHTDETIAAPEQVETLSHSARAESLSAKIEALEAAIGQTKDQWEPDGEVGDDYAGTVHVAPMAWRDHEAETQAQARGDESGLSDLDEAVLDEESLRELVSDIVRQELQGALGERITRNVRKLVRREIHRALAAQELD